MTTPSGPIGYNDVNAEMGLSPRVISSTYRYVNLLERHNPAEVAWSRLRNQSRTWYTNQPLAPLSYNAAFQTAILPVTQFFPNVLPGDAFNVTVAFSTNWAGNFTFNDNQFDYGRMVMDNRRLAPGLKGVVFGTSVNYDGGDNVYATIWVASPGKSSTFFMRCGVLEIQYLPAIPNPP